MKRKHITTVTTYLVIRKIKQWHLQSTHHHQLKTNKTSFLHSNKKSIHNPSPLCPFWNTQVHDTTHLFTWAHMTIPLSVLDLWTYPTRVVLLLDVWKDIFGKYRIYLANGHLAQPPLYLGGDQKQHHRKHMHTKGWVKESLFNSIKTLSWCKQTIYFFNEHINTYAGNKNRIAFLF